MDVRPRVPRHRHCRWRQSCPLQPPIPRPSPHDIHQSCSSPNTKYRSPRVAHVHSASSSMAEGSTGVGLGFAATAAAAPENVGGAGAAVTPPENVGIVGSGTAHTRSHSRNRVCQRSSNDMVRKRGVGGGKAYWTWAQRPEHRLASQRPAVWPPVACSPWHPLSKSAAEPHRSRPGLH